METRMMLYTKRADFQKIAEEFGIDQVTARIIRNRDVVGVEQIRNYLSGRLSDLPEASLLPDIDHKGSTLGQKMKPVSAVVGVVAGHRNFFHWFLPYLVLAVILHFTAPQADKITFAVLLGVLSHLFLDALNPSGVPLLPGHRIHLLRIHTGTGVDKAIGGLLYLFACIGLAIWIFRMI